MAKPVNAKNPSFMDSGLKLLDVPEDDRGSKGGESHMGKAASPCPKPARAPRSRPDIAHQIGLQLRSLYDDVLAQPVPARFLDLLSELEKDSSREPKKGSGSRLSKDHV